jgi:primosomal protein N' (replication factor Y)
LTEKAQRARQAEFMDVALPLPLDRSFSYRLPAGVDAPPPGSRVRVPLGGGQETGVVLRHLRETQLDPALRRSPGRLREIEAVLDEIPWLDAAQLQLARWMAGYYGASLGETLRAMIPVKVMRRPRRGEAEPLPPPDRPLELNDAQAEALAAIEDALVPSRYAAFLLDGVTGSGKTEVYLQAIARVLEQGRQAIVLVPEISLTPQAARRFRARLGDRVGVFHSGLSAGERHGVWRAARDGEIGVVLGPRSAIFAPFPNLGLVVIDEEHDGSYKQTEKPRYHARSVALMRARGLGAAVIMGSATPSLESQHNVEQGKYHRLTLPDRVGGGRRPRIEIVDLGEQPETLFSPPLVEGIQESLDRGEKVMLLLNRRGHSRLRLCAGCGAVRKCSRCDISLTYHSSRDRLLCHYCGQSRPLEDDCPECGGNRWRLLGAGTQQLEMELGLLFPDAPIHRMDVDSTRRRGAHREILGDFAAPGPSLLLGTQMIAKGHHFPEVTLVGVLLADTGLFLPDFRAAERSWQLLEQVSGRAGRGKRRGRALIQTYNPDHPVLRALVEGTLETLVAEELRERRLLSYPPHRPLVSLVLSGPEEAPARQAAEMLLSAFREQWPESPVSILGPAPAFLARLKDRYRQQLLVKGRLSREQKRWFLEFFQEISRRLGRSGALALELDVDPESVI